MRAQPECLILKTHRMSLSIRLRPRVHHMGPSHSRIYNLMPCLNLSIIVLLVKGLSDKKKNNKPSLPLSEVHGFGFILLFANGRMKVTYMLHSLTIK